ncbi:DUF3782 domain-containing protein [Infirmifilum lucidum]|uniref:DUF3782 domain-containing protein n=1 Tax=Infirmifilum lucidum TaxID=2776706 RepID=A0A7L9FG43_9CREN|nr:DUF3782 domain-containing protein [Infirmifilum lucidum]QOJ78788.1 DUF3782 domain-containing protein [Infirmifilum lucidum]
MGGVDIKREVLRLLREDEEFRYAVAGLIGLEEILKRMDRHEEELVKLREDMNRLVEDMNRLREDMNKLREDMNKLREDMMLGFQLVNRRLDALGARWGLVAEEAFREGLRGILEKELGARVERWTAYDERGVVYGYPSVVEVDVAISDARVVLVEVSSHVRPSDVVLFARKARFYEEATGRKPDRLVMVTPYAEGPALEAARRHGVEIYTRV